MAKFKAGDKIEHKPSGLTMTVTGTGTCHRDSVRPDRHPYYKVETPSGRTDEVCSYDVRKA